MINYREIQISDIPDLFRVRIKTWENDNGEEELTSLGITPDTVEQMIRNGSHHGWLCEIDNEVVGFAMGNWVEHELWVIAVLKKHEKKGIGKELLVLVEEWLSLKGSKEIWLTTFIDENERAVGFYKRLGWEDWKFTESVRYMKKKIAH